MGLLDVDYETSIYVYYMNSSGEMRTKTIVVPQLGDNSYQLVDIDVPRVQKITLDMKRSAGVSSLSFCYPGGSTPPNDTCPESPPNFDDSCVGFLEGLYCPYGYLCCCGSCGVPYSCECIGEEWRCLSVSPCPPTCPPTPSPPTAAPGCTLTTVDFSKDDSGSSLAAGTYVQNEWKDYGLVLSSTGGFGTLPRLFDTYKPGTVELGDPDLVSFILVCFQSMCDAMLTPSSLSCM